MCDFTGRNILLHAIYIQGTFNEIIWRNLLSIVHNKLMLMDDPHIVKLEFEDENDEDQWVYQHQALMTLHDSVQNMPKKHKSALQVKNVLCSTDYVEQGLSRWQTSFSEISDTL